MIDLKYRNPGNALVVAGVAAFQLAVYGGARLNHSPVQAPSVALVR